MDANLREHFDRAVSDDPGADLEEMVQAAITRGGRIRRRRKQTAVAGVAAGVVLVLGVVAGVNHRSPGTGPANPAAAVTPPAVRPTAAAPAMMMLAAAVNCSADPVEKDATDVVVFPGDAEFHVTDQMVAQLRSALKDDPRVGALSFETHEQAYRQFKKQWPNDPGFVASVNPGDLPEFFRLRLVDPGQYTAFRTQYAARNDVTLIEGRICRTSAPVGGIR